MDFPAPPFGDAKEMTGNFVLLAHFAGNDAAAFRGVNRKQMRTVNFCERCLQLATVNVTSGYSEQMADVDSVDVDKRMLLAAAVDVCDRNHLPTNGSNC